MTATWTPSRRPPGGADVLALAVWTAAIVGFFRDALGLRGALFYFDITEINYPYRAFLADELRAGRLSRWMPGLFCGLPLFSESQAGYFHPLKLLYLGMPTWGAFNYDTILSVWLTGLAAYGWLRRHVGPAGALTGSAIIGLSGYTWAHLIHTSMINALPSVPLAVWALECAWEGGRLRGVGLGALAIACQVFAGHLQDTILTGLALGLYALYRAAIEVGWRRKAFAAGAAVGMVVLGGMVAGVQAVPSKELIDRSPRAGGLDWGDLTYGSFSPELIPTLLVREAYGTRARDTDWMDGFYPYHEMDVYMGALGLALAVVGAGAYRDRWVGFWVLLAGVGGALMLGRFTILSDPMPWIPIVSSGRIPVRYHLWVALAVGVLAAVGVDRLSRPGRVRLRGAAAGLGVLAAVSAPILVHVYRPVWTDAARWTTPYHLARYRWLGEEVALASGRDLLIVLVGGSLALRAARSSDPRARGRLAGVVPVLVLADLLAAHGHDVPTVSPAYWTDPPRSARLIREDRGAIRVSGAGVLHAGEPGYASEPSRVDFARARDTLAWSLPPVWGLKSSGGITPIVSQRYRAYGDHARFGLGRFDIEGVTHLLTGEPVQVPGWGPPVRAGAAFILRNPGALPRARLMGRPVYANDRAGSVRALERLGAEARLRVIVEDPSRPLAPDAVVTGSASIVREVPERVEVETDSPGDAYLVLADTFDPGWSATRDGVAVPIRPALVAFRAVFVPRGKHRVVFIYRPAGFLAGASVTAVGATILLAALAWPRRVATLGPEHGDSGWSPRWPWFLLAILAALLAVSIVRIGPGGRPEIQDRWSVAFHRFTWGAGVEAMRPPPPSGD